MTNDTHREYGRHGRGRRGKGFRGFGGRGPGFQRGRKFSSEELQLIILALLEGGPAHGYELIRTLEEKSGGYYVPSPGVIYPALTFLSEIGHADCTKDGQRKLYSLTEEGRNFLDEHRDDAKEILETLTSIAGRMDNVRAAYSGSDDLPAELQEKFEALRSLKRALRARRGCPPEEAQRIAAILRKAAEDISAI